MMSLTPSFRTPGEVRRSAARWLREREVPSDIIEDLLLAVSELVTNAVLHGTAPIRAALRLTTVDDIPSVVFECSDAAPILAAAYAEEGYEERGDYGRGILVVQSVTDILGVTSSEKGKMIWVSIALAR